MGGKTSGLLLAFGARGGASDPEDLVHFCCQKLRVWFMNQSSYAKAVGRIRASARQRSAVSRSQSTDKGWNLVTTKSHVAQEMIGLLRMASAKLMEMMLKGERDTGSTCTKTPGLSALKNQKTGTFPRTKFGPGMRTMEMPWTSRYAGQKALHIVTASDDIYSSWTKSPSCESSRNQVPFSIPSSEMSPEDLISASATLSTLGRSDFLLCASPGLRDELLLGKRSLSRSLLDCSVFDPSSDGCLGLLDVSMDGIGRSGSFRESEAGGSGRGIFNFGISPLLSK